MWATLVEPTIPLCRWRYGAGVWLLWRGTLLAPFSYDRIGDESVIPQVLK